MQIAIILGLIAIIFLLIYKVFPLILKNYQAEKWAKLALFLTGAIYVFIDLLKKGKTAFAIALAIGSLVFTYVLFMSKKKE